MASFPLGTSDSAEKGVVLLYSEKCTDWLEHTHFPHPGIQRAVYSSQFKPSCNKRHMTMVYVLHYSLVSQCTLFKINLNSRPCKRMGLDEEVNNTLILSVKQDLED